MKIVHVITNLLSLVKTALTHVIYITTILQFAYDGVARVSYSVLGFQLKCSSVIFSAVYECQCPLRRYGIIAVYPVST